MITIALLLCAWLCTYLLAYRLGRGAGWEAYRRMRWEEARNAGLPVPADWDR